MWPWSSRDDIFFIWGYYPSEWFIILSKGIWETWNLWQLWGWPWGAWSSEVLQASLWILQACRCHVQEPEASMLGLESRPGDSPLTLSPRWLIKAFWSHLSKFLNTDMSQPGAFYAQKLVHLLGFTNCLLLCLLWSTAQCPLVLRHPPLSHLKDNYNHFIAWLRGQHETVIYFRCMAGAPHIVLVVKVIIISSLVGSLGRIVNLCSIFCPPVHSEQHC